MFELNNFFQASFIHKLKAVNRERGRSLGSGGSDGLKRGSRKLFMSLNGEEIYQTKIFSYFVLS